MKRVIRSLSIVALTLGLTPGIAAAGDGVPRTASGRPDLTGNYNAATVTPLQRPERYGDNLYLSKEEAARIEGNMAARIEETSQASDPDREAPPEGGDGSDGGAGNVGGYNFFWLDRGTEAFAVDGRFRTSILIDPPNGRFPPMTESAARRAAATQAKIVRGDNDGTAFWLESDEPGPFDGPESLLAQERCIVGFTGATPTLPSGYNNYKTIVQTEDHVMILIEMVHDARVVRMKSEGRAVAHLPSEIKKWAGDSIGWWEGDTLVVDTTNFHPEAFLRRWLHGDARCRALYQARGRRRALPLHGGRSLIVDSALDRRVCVAFDDRPGLRVRLPRGELLHGEHPARRSRARGGRAGELRKVSRGASEEELHGLTVKRVQGSAMVDPQWFGEPSLPGSELALQALDDLGVLICDVAGFADVGLQIVQNGGLTHG